jgi:hypothetical protein
MPLYSREHGALGGETVTKRLLGSAKKVRCGLCTCIYDVTDVTDVFEKKRWEIAKFPHRASARVGPTLRWVGSISRRLHRSPRRLHRISVGWAWQMELPSDRVPTRGIELARVIDCSACAQAAAGATPQAAPPPTATLHRGPLALATAAPPPTG